MLLFTHAITSYIQTHYDQQKVFMANAPVVFRTFWNMVKPFLDPVTKEKITFASGRHAKESVMEVLDLDKVEPCIFGSRDRPFDNKEYFALPFDCNFDDKDG